MLRDLSVGPRRFQNLHEGLSGVPTSLLTNRLRDLETAELIARKTSEAPGGGVLYTLTMSGEELVPILDVIGWWGAKTMVAPEPQEVITGSSLATALRAGYRPGALLLGRRTFDTFAAHWPEVTEPADVTADRINNNHKYIVISTPLRQTWSETSTALGANFLDEIATLKARNSDLELQVHGSIRLARTLHREGLIDTYRFLIAPVVLGQGARLFEQEGPAFAMKVERRSMTENGLLAIEMTPREFTNTLTASVQNGQDSITKV